MSTDVYDYVIIAICIPYERPVVCAVRRKSASQSVLSLLKPRNYVITNAAVLPDIIALKAIKL